MPIDVVGATGAVGTALLEELRRLGVHAGQLRAFASERSAGTLFPFGDQGLVVHRWEPGSHIGARLVFFAAGAEVSRRGVPGALAAGAVVIDNSSSFRMDPGVPLVVPEVNGHCLRTNPPPQLVANPNCSTAQLVCALAPLHTAFGLREVVVSTYQSVSGTGRRALATLQREQGLLVRDPQSPYPHPIAANVIPQVGDFNARGDGLEEIKLREETRKILALPDLAVMATAVRVPTRRGHGESVLARFEHTVERDKAERILSGAPGLIVNTDYATPRQIEGRREVFVGRVRVAADDPCALQLWVVADNLLKGAAWNAVQIAVELGLLNSPPHQAGRSPSASALP